MSQDSPLALRDARREDAAELAAFAIAMAWETEHKRLDPDTVRRGVDGAFEQPGRGRGIVAERDGAIVGMLMITYEWSDWRCADWWWIQSVYVVEQARRSGVYRALYRHVHALAEASGSVCGLRLYVERDNRNAQSTYASLGMQDAGYLMYEATLPWVAKLIGKG